MKRKQTIIAILIYMFFLSSCKDVSNNRVDIDKSAIATVDNEQINKTDLYKVMFKFENKSNLTLKRILQDSIDEIIMVKEAKKNGIKVGNDEIEAELKRFREDYPEVYNEALDYYSVKSLNKKIKTRILVGKEKNNLLSSGIVKKSTVLRFKKMANLSISDENVESSYKKELEEFAIQEWLTQKRKEYSIKYSKCYKMLADDIYINNYVKDMGCVKTNYDISETKNFPKEVPCPKRIKGFELNKKVVYSDGTEPVFYKASYEDSKNKSDTLNIWGCLDEKNTNVESDVWKYDKREYSNLKGQKVLFAEYKDESGNICRAEYKKGDIYIVVIGYNIGSSEFALMVLDLL